ncbi:hypothetical protein ES332_A12G310300v1 [Gossypium tomentosum]|uniref:CASP-like protein n=1 Tax=Gossypium tomentosum TaxID=34277 RepID=A0A5D2N4L2_GOSTO|nr:hypothetical protein ES332_A12G310300v1 [Gossypium tomentosum]
MKRNQYPNEIMKRSSSTNSETMTHYESPHSPLRLHTHFRSDQGDSDNNTSNYASPEASPVPQHPAVDNSMALVAIDKSTQFNTNSSPTSLPSPPLPPSTPAQQSLHLSMNRAVREEGPGVTTKTKVSGGAGGGGGARAEVLRRSKVYHTATMAALGFRLSEIVLCLISFSVMAADKTQGWSGDSYDRYKEYRYCLAVNVIGFVYAGFQAYDVSYYLMTETHVIHHYLFPPFEFFMDQHHQQQPHEWTIGNLIGGKMSSLRWLVPQLQWPFWLSLLLHLAQLYLVSNSGPIQLHEISLRANKQVLSCSR